jgi:hypothetical protein
MNPFPDMNLKPKHLTLSPSGGMKLSLITLVGLAAFVRESLAQDVLAPRPEYSVVPPALQELPPDQLEVFPPPGRISGPLEKPLAQWGPIAVRPHAYYSFTYGTGIPAAGSNHVTTTIQDVSPGILFNIGSHWNLDYTPTWRFYSSKDFKDTLDHHVILSGGTTYEDWILGLSQSYQSSSAPLVETGTQTDQETFLTTLTGSYHFNSKMWMDLSLNQDIVSTEEFTSYNEWSTLDWLNYQLYPQVETGVGVGLGYVDLKANNPDMTYEQLQGRVGWRATEKLSFSLRGGVEHRQFLSGGDGELWDPIAGAAIQYQPFEYTRISIHADRVMAASYFQSTATENAEVMADLNQRLLGVLFLDLSGGYHTTRYVASTGDSAGRTDDYYIFNARLSTSFLKHRGSAAVFYQYSDNSSTSPGFDFVSNQVGFELGYRY